MFRLLLTVILFSVVATACAPMALQPPTPTPTPVPPTATPTPAPDELTPAQKAALQALAEALGVSADQLKLTGTEAVEWPDGCLGVGQPDMSCLAAIVPGFRVLFDYQGTAYEVRTNEDGLAVALGEPLSKAWAAKHLVLLQLRNKFGDAMEARLVSVEAREWPNGCLGQSAPNIRCAGGVTRGFRLVWEVAGKQYVYHTDEAGNSVVEAVAMFQWNRQGGIAGFCDSLTVNTNGEVRYSLCGQPEKQAELTDAELAQLRAWGDKVTGTMIDRSDPEGVSDRMTVTILISGFGEQSPSEDEQQAIVTWIQDLYGRLK
ncbi:MAG: hypothetical protein JNL09_05510 [Anaerolineales bacterium]|nr:hypothetical protein [Anaerolineales bacterium]